MPLQNLYGRERWAIVEKKKLLPYLFSSVQIYEEYLLDRRFLFIAQPSGRNVYKYFEAEFRKSNFMHLTGCKYILGPLDTEDTPRSLLFYDLCLAKRLSVDSFSISPEAQLKLPILGHLFNLQKSSKMTGDFNNSGILLYADKITGSRTGALGFILGDLNPIYSPSTALLGDTRQFISGADRIVAVYRKTAIATLYEHDPYVTPKEFRGREWIWPPEIASKISPQ